MILILVKYFLARFLDEANGYRGTAIGNLKFYFAHIANGVSSLRKHPAGTSVNSAFFKEISNFCLGPTMVVYKKKDFEAYINR